MTDTTDAPEIPQPMRPVEFYVLLALAREDLHGYGIIRVTERQSGGKVVLDPGTLYRAIQRLRKAGLLQEAERREAGDLEDRRRRYYTLTAEGRELAAEEAERLAGLVRTAAETELLDDPGVA